MALAIMTSVCAAAMSNEFFGEIFSGDTAYIADFVKTEKKSVSDENYTLTLEQYLVAEKQAMIIFSIEAHSDTAISEFNAIDERGKSTFWDMDTIGFGPVDYDKANISGFSTGSLSEKFDTNQKRYFALKCDSIDNKEMIDFYLCTNKIKGSPKIIFPMKSNIETKTLKFDNIEVQYNPISIIVTTPVSYFPDECDSCYYKRNDIYFRTKNGDIKTYTQLYDYSSGRREVDENHNDKSYTSMAWAREIIKPDEIKSVIINDTEYPINDVLNPVKVEIDNHLKPFMIKPYIKTYLWLPLRETCEKLGADISWDEASRSAVVKYRESTYVFTPGTTKVIINGETVDFYDDLNDTTTFIDENERMIVSPHVTEKMNIDCHSCNTYNDDNTLNKNAMIHILP